MLEIMSDILLSDVHSVEQRLALFAGRAGTAGTAKHVICVDLATGEPPFSLGWQGNQQDSKLAAEWAGVNGTACWPEL